MLPILMICLHGYLQKDEPDHHITGPDAAEGDAVHADHLHLHVPLVPSRSDPVLAGESNVISIIQQTIIYRQLEEGPAFPQLIF